MTLGNGLTITNEFDQLYRLTDSRAGNLYNRTYGYYSTGNIKTITDNLEPAGSQSFIYNELGRLTNAVGKYGELSYQYDPVGNRLSSTAGEQTTTYGYKPESNRLTSFSTNNETTNYSYDDGGNLLSKGEQSLSWSPDNRLLSVAQQDQTLGEYGYDARGLRTIRTTAEQTTMTLYDQAGNMLVETDEEGNIQREFAYLDGQRITLFDYTMNPEVYVEVYTSTGVKQSEVPIYGFDDQNQYTGLHAETDENGIAIFQRADFGEGSFTFRVDYLSGQFWSTTEIIKRADTITVVIEEEPVDITVTLAGGAKEGQKVYLYDNVGNYLGLFAITDAEGKANFILPEGVEYRFLTEMLGNQYWSDSVTVSDGGSVTIIPMGGGIFSLYMGENADLPLAGLNTHLFNSQDEYLGLSATSNDQGLVSYLVPEGDYKIRVDYLGYPFWSSTLRVLVLKLN